MGIFDPPQTQRWMVQGAYVRVTIGPEGPFPCPYEDGEVAYKWWLKGWSKVHEELLRHPERENL